jgi:hypothetical protein
MLALALAGSIGLHWAFLQSVAWVGMIISYSHKASVTEALEKTFDGKHPCPLCKSISKSQKAEKKSVSTLELKKLEFPYAPGDFAFIAPTFCWEVRADNHTADVLTHAPPRIPPRSLPG